METVPEEGKKLYLVNEDIKSAIITMFKTPKKIKSKELKEVMRRMSH